jgi:predicted DNA-binding ribbon-helix-helix protein
MAERMQSLIVKRSILIAGHKTSVSLEDAFWQTFKAIAHRRQTTVSELATEIQNRQQEGNLSSAIRVFVLGFYRDHPARKREMASDAGDCTKATP